MIRYNVHRSTTAGFTPSTANRIAQPTGHELHRHTGLSAGTYYFKVTAEDAAGNIGPASNEANAIVTTPAVTGLVGAYGFDAGTGTTTADQSGNGNTGTLTNTTWVDDGEVRQRALVQRHELLGHRRRLELARPDSRDDDRGLGPSLRSAVAGRR